MTTKVAEKHAELYSIDAVRFWSGNERGMLASISITTEGKGIPLRTMTITLSPQDTIQFCADVIKGMAEFPFIIDNSPD